jgi:hypothetical protein
MNMTAMIRFVSVVSLLLLAGCGNTVYSLGETKDDPALYATIFPYYIETCAVSAMKKMHGLGFEYQGGAGGHAVVYLNGVCRDAGSSYPSVHMCRGDEQTADSGVGLSSNGHFSNAAWIATPGRQFFFDGALDKGEGVTRASYDRTQARAKQLGILDGVVFHEDAYDELPPGMSRAEFKYEASVGTDYAISLGRGRFCARLPVNREQMQRVVAHLNAQNAQYRDGKRTFEMTVTNQNCSHFTHNVLAAAGLWDEWPTDRFVLISALSFPVPKNEFVNQMRRSNDLPIDDPVSLYRDAVARQALLRDDWLPDGPGAIADAEPVRAPNDIYETNVNLIFYDRPVLSSLQSYFDNLPTDPRYTDLAGNLHYYADVYSRIGAEWKSPEWWLAHSHLPSGDDASFVAFYKRYHDYVDRMNAAANHDLLTLQKSAHPVVVAAGGAARDSN